MSERFSFHKNCINTVYFITLNISAPSYFHRSELQSARQLIRTKFWIRPLNQAIHFYLCWKFYCIYFFFERHLLLCEMQIKCVEININLLFTFLILLSQKNCNMYMNVVLNILNLTPPCNVTFAHFICLRMCYDCVMIAGSAKMMSLQIFKEDCINEGNGKGESVKAKFDTKVKSKVSMPNCHFGEGVEEQWSVFLSSHRRLWGD